MKNKASFIDIKLGAVTRPTKDSLCWQIFYKGVRAGKVLIKNIDDQPTISMELNKAHQNMGIGRVALSNACFASRLPEIFATVRKSHKASLKMAKYAGFNPVADHIGTQARLVWKRDMAEAAR